MFGLIAIGLGVGVLSGTVGVGGGIFLVPALHYFFKFSQHEAQGTSIAVLVPPIGILAALTYYRHGQVRLPVVAWIALGFAVGAFLGALLADQIPEAALRRTFALFMLFVGWQMLFATDELQLGAVLPAALATGAVGVLAWAERRLGIGRSLRMRLVRWIHRRSPLRDSETSTKSLE